MIDFLLTRNFAKIFAFGAEYVVVLWFFKPIENRTEGRWRWLGYLSLAAIAYLYFTPQTAAGMFAAHSAYNFMVQCARLLLHWAAVSGYLAACKEMRLECVLYQGGMYTILYQTAQNIRFVSVLLNELVGVQGGYPSMTTYLTVLVECLLVLAVHRWIDISKIQTVGRIRWALIILTTILGIYFKWSLSTMDALLLQDVRWFELLTFAVCAILGLMLVVFLFEVNQQAQEQQRQAELEQVSLNYEMQNAKRALQTNNDIRRLYHDMKNHLLTLQSLAEDGGRVEEYLQQLLPRFEGYESQVSTGNPTVDALLSEKVQRAALDNIQFNIYMNLTSLGQMQSVDLVTIFGNAVDNAIEAVQALPEGTERIIYLKSSRMANLTVLRFSNQFAGKRLQEGGTLLTSKSDKRMHGIGLNSIQKAARRYGGSVTTRINNQEGWFSLMVMIPGRE